MGIIVDAIIIDIEAHDRYCVLWLDAYPKKLRIADRCLIGGLVFEQASVHYAFHNPKKQTESSYIAIKLGEADISSEWFIGKEVAPAYDKATDHPS